MKFCKDCFYIQVPKRPDLYRGQKDDLANAYCGRTKTYDMVTGNETASFCSVERESMRSEACGKDAQYYEEPEPREMWQRDEPQGATNWDTGWNGVYSEQEGM